MPGTIDDTIRRSRRPLITPPADGPHLDPRTGVRKGYGKYLLVNGSGLHFFSVFAVNGRNLTEVPSSPAPLPARATSSCGIVNTEERPPGAGAARTIWLRGR